MLVAASSFVSPPVALTMGLIFGLVFAHPYPKETSKFSRWLLQASVVGLGFGMNLHEVLRAGRSGFVYTFMGIAFAMLVGMGLGRLLAVRQTPAFLISTGTAICGGSAIAAVGPIVHASDEEMAVSLGTVFVLNSVALLTFPAIGAALHLSQTQFGLWAALAIHDTSSVVGAAAKFGRDRARGWHDGQVGESIVDCASGAGDRNGAPCESAHTMAVVYRTLCCGGGVQHISSRRRTALRSAVKNGAHWADGNAVFDRERHFAGDAETGGAPSADAGRPIVAGGFGYVAVVDPARMDPALGGRILLVFGIVLKQDAEKPERGDWDHDQAAEDANQEHSA